MQCRGRALRRAVRLIHQLGVQELHAQTLGLHEVSLDRAPMAPARRVLSQAAARLASDLLEVGDETVDLLGRKQLAEVQRHNILCVACLNNSVRVND